MSVPSLGEMLKYKRPSNSWSEREFCERFIEPQFGERDHNGNYILHLGDSNVMFTAHYDSVHWTAGKQAIVFDGDMVRALGSDCLGADCATGVWLILNMIEMGVPGHYVIFAEEESGCIGSGKLRVDCPNWLTEVSACISFDRKGYDSIITHQTSWRTASDAFAKDLGARIGLGMKPDDTGSYTDSNEFADLIPECTNVSVGYFAQHTKNESQDMAFAYLLAEKLIHVDWEKLTIERDPDDYESAGSSWGYGWWNYGLRDTYKQEPRPEHEQKAIEHYGKDPLEDERLYDIVTTHPYKVAKMLESWGYDAHGLSEDLELSASEYLRAIGG